jgi:hypothetical protein
VRVTGVEQTNLGGGLTRISAVIENAGHLPTYVLSSARDLPWNEPLRARLVPGAGVEIAGGEAETLVGHLEGWGGQDRGGTPSFARTAAAPVRRRVSWVVKGKGSVTIQASAARIGCVEARIHV